MLYSHNRRSIRREDIIKKIIQRGKYIYRAVLDLLKNKDASNWICAVPTRVVQQPSVVSMAMKIALLGHTVRAMLKPHIYLSCFYYMG